MKYFSIPTHLSQSQNKIKIDEIAPTIIDEVAHLLIDRHHTETDTEIRFGNRGSFAVDKRNGTFYDFQEGVGGGMLKMICYLTGLEHEKQAFDWLQEKGFIDGTFTPSQRAHRPKAAPRQTTGDMFKVGLDLWSQSEPIPFYQRHPVRRWCLHRNLLPGYKELSPTIRWHPEYKRGVIIVALAPIQDFIDAYPEPPAPRQFHLIAIDKQGRKRKAFKKDDKRTWGRPGVTCVALFGNPNADEIYIAEGIADAIAIYGRQDNTPVIATIGSLSKMANCPKSLDWLSDGDKRAVTIFPDNDDPGRKARDALMEAIGRSGGDVCYVENWKANDPADAAAGGIR